MQPIPKVIGRSVERNYPLKGAFWFKPEDAETVAQEAGAESELEALGGSGQAVPQKPAPREQKKSVFLMDIWPTTFEQTTQGLLLPWFWLLPLLFVSLQLGCFAVRGDSLFGTLTDGIVESLKLAVTGRAMTWHMCGASGMWALGAAQFLLKPLRHGRLACVHRFLGRAYLALWCSVVGPTAMYLSLYVGTGPIDAQLAMTAFSVVSLDTALFAYYFFWRGWCIARNRVNGAKSFDLHRKAMSSGIVFTMTILFQRPFQSLVIGLRGLLLHIASILPASWAWAQWASQGVALTLLDHNIGLAWTTCMFGISISLIDGPRSWIVRLALGLDEDGACELYGSSEPRWVEVMFWRLRVPLYLALRAIVTRAWTIDPAT